MAKIVIIGAGSGFGSRLSLDVLSREPLADSTIALCDIDPGRLEDVARYVQRVMDAHNLPAKLVASTDRAEMLVDADFVVTSVSVGGAAYWGKPYEYDIRIPASYGVDQSVGDTIGPGGVFRFLRTAPVQLEFCRDIERLCPDALMLNHTNPMAMLTWLHHAASSVRNVGLCHSVQGTTAQMARWAGLEPGEITYHVAGINHQAWVLAFRRDGEDAYPLLRKAFEADEELRRKESVRYEMMRQFGYFVTESTRHNSEYLPYFRRTPELREQFGLPTREVSATEPRRRAWARDAGNAEADPEVPALVRSNEYTSAIIEAAVTNVPARIHGNVMNHGLITNLPEGCCAEVPCLIDAAGVHPCHVGELPAQCAALNRSNVSVQELAVRAALDRDREAAFHAVALDPLTASVLPLDRIRRMFDEMWDAQKDLLAWMN